MFRRARLPLDGERPIATSGETTYVTCGEAGFAVVVGVGSGSALVETGSSFAATAFMGEHRLLRRSGDRARCRSGSCKGGEEGCCEDPTMAGADES